VRITDRLRHPGPGSRRVLLAEDAGGGRAPIRHREGTQPLDAALVSVIYRASCSTWHLTVDLVTRIKHDFGFETMALNTCIRRTTDERGEVVGRLAASEIEDVLALRRNPPKCQTNSVETEGGRTCTARGPWRRRETPRDRLNLVKKGRREAKHADPQRSL